jgi:hypothetical protein
MTYTTTIVIPRVAELLAVVILAASPPKLRIGGEAGFT